MFGELTSVIARSSLRVVWFLQGFGIALLGVHTSSSLHAQGTYDRTRIPVADVRPEPNREIDPSKAKMPKQTPFGAPANAPNVVIILLDASTAKTLDMPGKAPAAKTAVVPAVVAV